MYIKGKGTIIRLMVMKMALYNRKQFAKLLNEERLKIFYPYFSNRKTALELVSFSSHNDLPEQILSILSFLRYCGEPRSWTIYSDGTHTKNDANILSFFPFLRVIYTPFAALDEAHMKTSMHPYLETLRDYASRFPMGKKLFLNLNHPVVNPTIFLDSDVLFYNKAANLSSIVDESIKGYFLKDVAWGNFDNIYLSQNTRNFEPVNGGFFILLNELIFEKGLEHLEALNRNYHYFSEQTTLHIIFNDNQMQPLDSCLFFLNTSDQFSFKYNFRPEDIVLRHYVSPVRYKMWQKNWKWHLGV